MIMVMIGSSWLTAVHASLRFMWNEPSPVNMDDPLIRAAYLSSDGCAITKSHGPQTTAGDKILRLVVLEILSCPHLMLAYIGNVNGLLVSKIANCVDDLARMECASWHLTSPRLLFPFHGLSDPFLMILLLT